MDNKKYSGFDTISRYQDMVTALNKKCNDLEIKLNSVLLIMEASYVLSSSIGEMTSENRLELVSKNLGACLKKFNK